MATQVQFRRGTTAQNNAFTGAVGEITVDTDQSAIRVHDGSTAGGVPAVSATGVQTLTNKTLTAPVINNPTIGGTGSVNLLGNITIGNLIANSAVEGASLTISTTAAITGNVTTGNVSGETVTGNVISSGSSELGTVTIATLANITATTGASSTTTGALKVAGGAGIAGNIFGGGVATFTGNVTGGNITTAGVVTVNSGGADTAIVNGGSNAVGNIGSATSYFNRLFATSTSALYADLAENYVADAEYTPGTVLVFGGDQEVTVSTEDHDSRVAGVVSTDPAMLMNSGIAGVALALIGRVPCRVVGRVAKGDRLVTGSRPGTAQSLDPRKYQPGSIIGKALEFHDSDGEGIIEIAVGKV